ncbi:hypothetical protein REPUB_Repub15cG0021100 [Reevesia pubescens]
MRAPGEVHASVIAEAIIEHVASTLSIDVDSVRNINLHTYNSLGFFYKSIAGEPSEYTLPALWDKLAISSSFYQRTEMIKEFNRCNKWRKIGISRVPIVHEVNVRPTPGKVSILRDGSIVFEVGGVKIDLANALGPRFNFAKALVSMQLHFVHLTYNAGISHFCELVGNFTIYTRVSSMHYLNYGAAVSEAS